MNFVSQNSGKLSFFNRKKPLSQKDTNAPKPNPFFLPENLPTSKSSVRIMPTIESPKGLLSNEDDITSYRSNDIISYRSNDPLQGNTHRKNMSSLSSISGMNTLRKDKKSLTNFTKILENSTKRAPDDNNLGSKTGREDQVPDINLPFRASSRNEAASDDERIVDNMARSMGQEISHDDAYGADPNDGEGHRYLKKKRMDVVEERRDTFDHTLIKNSSINSSMEKQPVTNKKSFFNKIPESVGLRSPPAKEEIAKMRRHSHDSMLVIGVKKMSPPQDNASYKEFQDQTLSENANGASNTRVDDIPNAEVYDFEQQNVATNNNEAIVEPTGNQEQVAMIPMSQEHSELRLENELFLTRIIGFTVAAAMASGILILALNKKISLLYLFIFMQCYLLYYVGETLKRISKYPNREDWRSREDYFCALDAFNLGVFFTLSHISLIGIHVSQYSAIPFAISAVAYLFSSKAPSSLKSVELMIRWFYVIQICFIGYRIDGVLDWDWMAIFGFSWIFIGVAGLYLCAFGIILLLTFVFALVKPCFNSSMNVCKELIGLLWHSLYYGLSVVAYFILIGVGRAFGPMNNFDTLRTAGYVSLGFNTFFSLFTICLFKSLVDYLQVFNTPLMNHGVQYQVHNIQPKKQITSFETEKKENFFIMLSSTYFMPLKQASFAKDQIGLERVKKLLAKFSMRGMHLTHRKKNLAASAKAGAKPGPGRSMHTIEAHRANTKADITSGSGKSTDVDPKLRFSADDMMRVRKMQTLTDHGDVTKDEDVCYICYDNPPDAVLMNCGHGGICYECAQALVQKSNICMECRTQVESIHRIERRMKIAGVIKTGEKSVVKKIDVSM